VKLTVDVAKNLKLPPGKKDHFEWDSEIAGFGYRLRDGGKRVWIYQYAVAVGTGDQKKQKTRRMTIGTYPAMLAPQARERARELHAEVKLGRDPAQVLGDDRARAGETFEACLKQYLEVRRKDGSRPSTLVEIERHLVKNLAPLHGLHIAKIDRRAIAIELTRLTAIGPVQANRTRASLVKFLGWCAKEGFVDTNPAVHTNKNKERPRDRVLKDWELRKIWHALPEGDFGEIVTLLMLTGARADEIAELRWSEIDLDRGVIALPATRTKNRRAHIVPMSPSVHTILEGRIRQDGRDLIFGRGQRGFSGWSNCKRKLDEAVKLEPWIIHDLRRAAATGMGEIGVAPWIIEAVLNHVSGFRAGVSGVYNRSQLPAEKAAALARWDDHLMAVIDGRESNIATLRRG
jgi:integrase